MEWLKLNREDILCRHINVSTVATMLALAEQHRRQGLKEACFEFLKNPGSLNVSWQQMDLTQQLPIHYKGIGV
jgi:speckle-type POZ protein